MVHSKPAAFAPNRSDGMAGVIKHPKYEQTVSAQLRRLKRSVEEDRERAIATLSTAVAKLERLCALCDVAELKTLSAEYGVFLNALKQMDPASAEDGVRAQLQLIERRLQQGLIILGKYSAGLPG